MNDFFTEQDHNKAAIKKIEAAYYNGERIVGIVHASNTKSYTIPLQYIYKSKPKNVIYITSRSNERFLKEVIEETIGNETLEKTTNICFLTYDGIARKDGSWANILKADLIVIEDFWHLGAPVWGPATENLVNSFPNAKILGLSAYTNRRRGTSYEKDIAEVGGEWLFTGKIVSQYDIVDAWMDGVLPIPVYQSAYFNLEELHDELYKEIKPSFGELPKENKTQSHLENELRYIQTQIVPKSETTTNIYKNFLKRKGKYIYYCPMATTNEHQSIIEVEKETKEKIKEALGLNESEIVSYISTSDMGNESEKIRANFANDLDPNGIPVRNKLRIMFVINQYNTPDNSLEIDGVILGRGTKSDIVYMEQLTKALTITPFRKKEEERYNRLSKEELRSLCKQKGIEHREKATKKELISLLIAPVVIDLTGNIEMIRNLQKELKHREEKRRIKARKGRKVKKKAEISKTHHLQVTICNEDIFKTLMRIKKGLNKEWDFLYRLAKKYYNTYKNLEVTSNFKTVNGYDYDKYGYSLGKWIEAQRKALRQNKLEQERVELLDAIKMNWGNASKINNSAECLNEIHTFYKKHGHLEIPMNYKTPSGIPLGRWLDTKRKTYKKTHKKTPIIEALYAICPTWLINNRDSKWIRVYKKTSQFQNKETNKLEIRERDTTQLDGESFSIGQWLIKQIFEYHEGTLEIWKIKLLDKRNIEWNRIDNKQKWWDTFAKAKNYYDKNQPDLLIVNTKGKIGEELEKLESLKKWLQHLRENKDKLTPEEIAALESIKMYWNEEDKWNKILDILIKDNLANDRDVIDIKKDTTTQGGTKTGRWAFKLQNKYLKNEFTPNQLKRLKETGLTWFVALLINKGIIKETITEENQEFTKEAIESRFYYLLDYFNPNIIPEDTLTSSQKTLINQIKEIINIYGRDSLEYKQAIMNLTMDREFANIAFTYLIEAKRGKRTSK